VNNQTLNKIISRKGEVKHCSVCGEVGHSRVFHNPPPVNRKCHVCSEVKPIASFLLQRSSRANGFTYQTYTHVCRECDLARSASRYRSTFENRFGYLLASVKSRCAKNDIGLSLTVADLLAKLKQQSGLCHYSKRVLSLDTGNDAVSIDRIDPFGPYSNENTVLVCWIVNHMKRQQSDADFVSLCRDIASNH